MVGQQGSSLNGRWFSLSTGTNFAFHDATGGADCQDGHDASGATCVDDGDNHGGSCEADDNETEGGDGTDARVLAADDGPDDGDAVPEHNFPGDGCADGGDNGGDD